MTQATPLILASASPRRRELLAYLGMPFTVLPSRINEDLLPQSNDVTDYAVALASAKAQDVASRHPSAAVLGADTIVVLGDTVLGKPRDEDEAREMLDALRRAGSHRVLTGISLVHEDSEFNDFAETLVYMRAYTDDEITAYIQRGEPFDKAGGYAIQDRKFRPVDRYEGCYCNVVGLPVALTQRILERACIELLDLRPPSLPPECLPCPTINPINTHNPVITLY